MNKLINNVTKVISEIIFEFFKPEYLKICISLFVNSLIKKSWVLIKKINGKISKTIEGALSKERYVMKNILWYNGIIV